MQPRYAQESHTHSGLVGGAGEGWSGVVSACHASAQGTVATVGFAATIAGLSTSVDIALSMTGTDVQRRSRLVRRLSGNYGGISGSTGYLNTWRGFHCRFAFGTLAYSNANPLFAGLFTTLPAAALTSFTGWASLYAIGVWKNPAADTLDWVWRTDAGTTGSASTGLSWIDGATYELSLDCEPVAAGGVTATLANTGAESVSYTFTSFPNTNTDPAVILKPGVFVGSGGSTTQLAFHSFDSVEPW